MDDAAPVMPEDLETLRALCATLRQEHATLRQERDAAARKADQLEAKSARMEAELLRLRKMVYGPRADRLASPEDLAQLLLEFAQSLESRPVNPEDLLPEDRGQTELRRVRRGSGRRNLKNFDTLPERVVEHDLPDDEKPCPCCGQMRHRIGAESSWQVEFIPGHFERLKHVRHTYVCPACERGAQGAQIQTAPKAPGTDVVEKGMAGPGLLAFMVTSKFADYLPLYRLEDIFERAGLAIARSTMCAWCRDVAEIAMPVYRRMLEHVLASRVVCTDDTVMPMLERHRCRKARMWVYVGDPGHPYNVFDFTLSRSRDGPTRILADFRGTLVADAYGGYNGVVVHNAITRAGCWAHARRKFVDAQASHPRIAAEAARLIGELFAIEARIKDADAAARTRTRAEESAPLLAKMKQRLLAWRAELLPKHPMADAVNYTLNQWEELSVFTRDAEVPIDNNVSEREMKRIVLNRKNSLFVGNERGGETAAILSSLTSTCRRHGIDPQLYLTQLLVNLPHSPASQLDSWLPDAWLRRQAGAE